MPTNQVYVVDGPTKTGTVSHSQTTSTSSTGTSSSSQSSNSNTKGSGSSSVTSSTVTVVEPGCGFLGLYKCPPKKDLILNKDDIVLLLIW